MKLNVENFPKDFNWDNGMFPPLDALTYWHYLQEAKKVIEVGCGNSTVLAVEAGVDLVAIDPDPRVPMERIIKKPVQSISVDMFTLEPKDILFIDSSHIYKEGNDVWYLIEKVIPTLKKGVRVHFHDYFKPYGYPEEWGNIEWNEQDYAETLAKKHKVLKTNYTLCKEHNEELKKMYPFVPEGITTNFPAVMGSSLWLEIK